MIDSKRKIIERYIEDIIGISPEDSKIIVDRWFDKGWSDSAQTAMYYRACTYLRLPSKGDW